MPRPVGTELYEVFIAVAETGGFTTAADLLHRTQTTVSQQIKRLEDTLDETLFTRQRRGADLTVAGEALLPYARQIIQLHEQATIAVKTSADRSLAIGIPDTYIDDLLPVILSMVGEEIDQPPNIYCDHTFRLFKRFSRGELDIIVAARHPDFPAGRMIRTERLAWIGESGFRVAHDQPMPLAVFPEGCPHRASLLAELRMAGIPWQILYTAQSSTSLFSPLRLGQAVSVLTVRDIPDGLVSIGEELGLPQMPETRIDLHANVATIEKYGETMVNRLLASISAALDESGR
jgi:DNA-binding transcriptional LysR family regulator